MVDNIVSRRLIRVGTGQLFVTIPKSFVKSLDLSVGDRFFWSDSSDGFSLLLGFSNAVCPSTVLLSHEKSFRLSVPKVNAAFFSDVSIVNFSIKEGVLFLGKAGN